MESQNPNLNNIELIINGRKVKPNSMIDEIGGLRSKFVNALLNLDNPSELQAQKFVDDLIYETLAISIDYAQMYCARMEEEYTNLFMHTNTGIGITDTETKRIISVNPYFLELLEIDEKDIIGKTIKEFFGVYIIDKAKYEQGRELFREHGFLDSFELKFKTKTGKERYFLVSSKNISELQKEIYTIVDATCLKDVELMQEYTTNVLAHDIKNPLTGAMGFTGLLEFNTYDEATKRQFIANIKKSLERIDSIICEHLDIMKFEKGTYKLKLTRFDLFDFLDDICRRFNQIYSGKGCFVDLDTRNKDQQYFVSADKKWLVHLFENVIKNALDEAEKNGSNMVILKVSIDDESIYVSVLNQGTISEELENKLFKVRYVKSTKSNGNGIGSYFAGLIAKIHGGGITIVKNSIEEGTNITVRLPLNIDQAPQELALPGLAKET